MYAQKLKAGKRRTYFFDVRATKYDDYYITITESKRKFNDGGYERHKIFLYKEDFNKFMEAMQNTVDHVKEELMPEYDFDQYDKRPEVITNNSYNNDYQKSEESTSTEEEYYTEETESTEEEEIKTEPVNEEQEEVVEEPVAEETTNESVDHSDEEAMTWD